MTKKLSLLLLLSLLFVLNGQTNIGFYPLQQKEGPAESSWIGKALPDMLSTGFANIKQVNVIDYHQIDNYLKEKQTVIADPLKISSFLPLKEGLKLQYLITGSYRHEINNGLPVNIVIYNFKNGRSTPIVIRGYANDLPTIVSYLTSPISRECGLVLNSSEKELLKSIDDSVSGDALLAKYKGEASLEAGDLANAVKNFEKAYRINPENKENKLNYDKVLDHFYGSGLFALKLLETDKGSVTDFSRQYLLSKEIFSGYATDIVSSELAALGAGSFFNIAIKVRLHTTSEVLKIANEAIAKFSKSGRVTVEDDVFDSGEEEFAGGLESFEKNISNTLIKIECLDREGKVVYSGSQNLKQAFAIRYRGEAGYSEESGYKKLFRQNSIETMLTVKTVSRDIVRQIHSIRADIL